MSDMFSVIAHQMDSEKEQLEGSRARIAATKRLQRRFSSYLSKAQSSAELDQRMATIEKKALIYVKEACAEHGYDKHESLSKEVIAELRKQAEAVATGDTYQQEQVKLPSADASGLGSEGSPKIDKKQVPAGGLDAIDVKSERHPLEHQNAKDGPDYKDLRHDGPKTADPTGGPREQVDADKAMQPEHSVAPNTDTWSDKGTQADGVTSSVESKWDVLS